MIVNYVNISRYSLASLNKQLCQCMSMTVAPGMNNGTTVWTYCSHALLTQSRLLQILDLSNEAGKEINVALHNLYRITEKKNCPII